MSRLPKWRKATWAIAIWNLLIVIWLITATSGTTSACTPDMSAETCAGLSTLSHGISTTVIGFFWVVGLVPLVIIWYLSRPHQNTTVWGPDGRQMIVSERKASELVKQGWSYTQGQAQAQAQGQERIVPPHP
jgi:hypothetical protein